MDVATSIPDVTGVAPGAIDLAARALVVDGVEMRVAPLGGYANAEHLVVVKAMSALDEYKRLLATFDRPRIVEIGVAYGGSTAFLALTARPKLLIGIELSPTRVDLLDDLIEQREMQDEVRLHYGVDQADAARLNEIMDADLGADPIDLVIDDASHRYEPTLAAFECLFPRVRPGGQYLIEDWSGDHAIAALLRVALQDPRSPHHEWAKAAEAGEIPSGHAGHPPQTAAAVASIRRDGPPADGLAPPPLSRLAAELVLAAAEPSSGVAAVTANRFWLSVERSEAPLEPGFTLAGVTPDHFGTLSRGT
jgi:cephalosporin hydroxylase